MGPGPEQGPAVETVRIWDAPTRVLKWSIALAVTIAYLLGANMTFETASTHFIVGYVVSGLLGARLIWGIVGPRPSRLSTMLRDIMRIPSYAVSLFKQAPSYWPGHNPIGSLSVIALWATIAFQIGTGLFAYSDSFFSGGPLSAWVDERTRQSLTAWHHASADVLLALIALHLAAIFFYAIWKSENLIGPMVSGWKQVSRREEE